MNFEVEFFIKFPHTSVSILKMFTLFPRTNGYIFKMCTLIRLLPNTTVPTSRRNYYVLFAVFNGASFFLASRGSITDSMVGFRGLAHLCWCFCGSLVLKRRVEIQLALRKCIKALLTVSQSRRIWNTDLIKSAWISEKPKEDGSYINNTSCGTF